MIALVAAVAANNVIGKDQDLPWNIPEDLKRFRELTEGRTVLMGRKTFESILARLGRPLPKRKNVVLTRDEAFAPEHENVVVYNDLDKVLAELSGEDVYVIGGEEVFRQTMDRADRLYITHIDKPYEGDTFFPEIDKDKWEVAGEEPKEGFRFVEYKRT